MKYRTHLDDASKDLSSRTRKPTIHKNELLVPLKYDDAGEPLTPDTFDLRIHLKKFKANDWVFLKTWRENKWDFEKTCELLQIDLAKGRRIRDKVNCIRIEEARDIALAQIPSTTYIQARHMENIIGGGILDDSSRDSLKELAKIQGSYKTTATQVNIQQNILQMPALDEETARKLRELADKLADQPTVVEGQVVNG